MRISIYRLILTIRCERIYNVNSIPWSMHVGISAIRSDPGYRHQIPDMAIIRSFQVNTWPMSVHWPNDRTDRSDIKVEHRWAPSRGPHCLPLFAQLASKLSRGFRGGGILIMARETSWKARRSVWDKELARRQRFRRLFSAFSSQILHDFDSRNVRGHVDLEIFLD